MQEIAAVGLTVPHLHIPKYEAFIDSLIGSQYAEDLPTYRAIIPGLQVLSIVEAAPFDDVFATALVWRA
jgi:hypothetical protein